MSKDTDTVTMPRRVRRRPVQDPDAIEAEVVREDAHTARERSDAIRRKMEPEEEEPEILTPLRRRRAVASEPEEEQEDPEEEEQPAPRRRRAATPDPEEDDEPAPAPKRRQRPSPKQEDEEEDEPTLRRRRAAAQDDEDDEEPKPKKKKRAARKVSSDTTLAKKDTSWVDGDADADDFEIPSIKVLHPMSDLADDLPDLVGQWVYNNEIGLGKSIEVVLVNIRKRFQEVVDDYDPNAPPEIFENRQEALEARVKVRPIAIVDLLITCPEGMEEEASIEVDETPYLMARWYCRAGYRKFMGPLKNHELKRVDKAPWDRYFTITAVKRKGGKGRNWDPVLKPTEEQTSKTLRSYISGMKG